jgi:hypothetical protein
MTLITRPLYINLRLSYPPNKTILQIVLQIALLLKTLSLSITHASSIELLST